MNLFYSLKQENEYNDKINQNNNYFLGKSDSVNIEKVEEFQKIILDKSDDVTKSATKYQKIPRFFAKKEFEEKFLKGKTIKETLEKSNIFIKEHFNEKSLLDTEQYYFENDKLTNKIDVKPFSVRNINGNYYSKIIENKPLSYFEPSFDQYFTVIIYPKNKRLNFIKTEKNFNSKIKKNDQIIYKTRKIYDQLEKKYALTHYETQKFNEIFDIVDSIQKENKLKLLSQKSLSL